jgi:methylthioxylose transferase
VAKATLEPETPSGKAALRRWWSGCSADLLAVSGAGILVATAVVVGAVLNDRDVPLHAWAAPLRGGWRPRLSPATPVAVALAVLSVAAGPAVAARWRWRTLLPTAWAASFAWIVVLALVDGWPRLASRLARPGEYLAEVPGAPPWSELLATFAERIARRPTGPAEPDVWVTHVAGHPPAALEFWILVDRLGLRGGGWAAVICLVLGSSACLAVAVAVRAMTDDTLARRALPFLVLVPAALWIGVSGDAVFLAVSAWGLALLAIATRHHGLSGWAAAGAAGLLLGWGLYLSYGLALIGPVAVGLLVAGRRLMPVLVAGSVVVGVVIAYTAGGFWWWDGYLQLRVRYYQGWGGERPYAYWVWANLAVLALCIGPAAVAGTRRAVAGLRPTPQLAAVVLPTVLAVTAATLSGLSKAEVERIWLPFAVWLVAACALLPPRTHRRWLAGQAMTALVVQHLIRTSW